MWRKRHQCNLGTQKFAFFCFLCIASLFVYKQEIGHRILTGGKQKSFEDVRFELSLRSKMFIIIIFITITQQPEQDRWAENQPTAGLSSLNEYGYENEYENGMRKSETELCFGFQNYVMIAKIFILCHVQSSPLCKLLKLIMQ